MPIWTHAESVWPLANTASVIVKDQVYSFGIDTCAFCNSPITLLAGRAISSALLGDRYPYGFSYDGPKKSLQICHACGWWVATAVNCRMCIDSHDDGYLNIHRSCGALKDLDVSDVRTPIEELRAYLSGRYDDRFSLHPKRFEDIVGAVFSDFGFRVRVTSFSGDGGIDVVVLDGDGDATVGVQVKRQQGKVTAEQIRSFLGALVVKGLTNGVYVTTSTYQRGASIAAAQALVQPGVAIELVDASRFYEALMITQHVVPPAVDDPSAPYFSRWRSMDEAPLIGGHSW